MKINLRENITEVLGVIIVVMSFIFLFAVIYKPIPSENKDLVNDAKKANINHLIKMIVWGAVSAIAFMLLVWLFIRRRHKKP